MNDLSIVCFTCKRDEELLPLHYKAIRRVTDNPVYYIVSKEDYDIMKFPKGSNPVVSDFDRNNNLIGIDALKGMLACYGYFQTDVLKIDSDVILMGIDWINTEASLHGFSPNRQYCCHGTGYFISKDCVKKVINFIQNYYLDSSRCRCEDQVISQVAAIVSEPYKVLIEPALYGNDNVNSVIFMADMFNNPKLINPVKAFINCADSSYLEPYIISGLDRTVQVKRAMEYVVSKLCESE